MTVTFTTDRSARRTQQILAALQEKPMTARELGRALCLGRVVYDYLHHLHARTRVHVSGWQGGRVPVYAAGPGEDAPLPAPTTGPQRRQAFMQKVYADPHRHDRFKASRRLKWRIVTLLDRRRQVPAILRGLI